MADVPCGVTMEEQGISKIGSVKFHKSGELALDKNTPLVPPAATPPVEDEEDAPHKRDETLEVNSPGAN